MNLNQFFLSIVLIITFLFTCCFKLYCQKNDFLLQKNPISIPLSPNVASLGKYFEQPIGSHTGIPEIKIPIWQIKTGHINFPIELSYHAGGIKVDEISSWVGLGWSTSVNGNISRIIRGKEDGSYDYNKINLLKDGLLSESDKHAYILDVLNGGIDSEPDLYVVSFPGINCKFFQSSSGEFITQPLGVGLKIEK
ncbi:hypothetical protein OKW96_17765 [Sphingobacterium sp. KU25419]|nr:hypothetical protein OKW96_17765 [Sphingobacterium sp. KU25419]